jgi:integrase
MAKYDNRRLAGEGSIRQRSTGKWEGRISVGVDEITGKRIHKSVYGANKSEVKRKMRDLSDELNELAELGLTNKPFQEGEIKYKDWLDEWMQEYKLNSVTAATYDSYKLAIENHIKPALGNVKIIEIKPQQIQKFLNSRQQVGTRLDKSKGSLSSAYTIKMKNIINASLKQAVKNRMIPFNPTDAITPPRLVQKEIRILSPDEQSKLMTVIEGHRLEALFKVALATGMRKGELMGLTWDCIDFDNMSIQIKQSVSRIRDPITNVTSIQAGSTKTKAGQRQIPMMPAIVPILKKHRALQDAEKAVAGSAYNKMNLVFCSNVGTYIEPRRINMTLEKLIRKANIEHINFHALRHTFATRALENGIPAKVVQVILGHKDVSLTLNTYSHVLQSTAHEQLEKMNALFEEAATLKPEKSPKSKDEPER